MTQLRSEITVQIKDGDAQQSLDKLITKLERARDLSQQINIPGGPGGAPGPGGPSGGAPGPGGGGGGDRGAPDRDRGGRPGEPQGRGRVEQGSFGQRAVQGFGTAVQGVASARNDPTFAINLFGKAVTDSMDAVSAGLKDIAEASGNSMASIPFAGAIAGVLGAGAVAAKVGQTIMNEAVSARFEQIMNIANIERPLEQARITGGGSSDRNLANRSALRMGTRFGFRAAESAQIMAQFSRSIGAEGGGTTALGAGVNPFEAVLSGLSPEMIARYISLGSRGGGAVQGVGGAAEAVQGAIGTLYGPNMELRGAKVDEALARIASATTMMAEQGVSLDLMATNRMMSGLAEAGAARAGQTRGRNVFEGMHGVRGALNLSRMGMGAAQQFAGGFGGLADAAIQAEAFRNASSPLEAIELMQQYAEDPGRVASIVTGQLGQDAAGLAFAGKGFSGMQARVLAQGVSPGRVRRGMGGADPSMVPLSRQLAEDERHRMAVVGRDPAENAAIIGAMDTIHDTLIRLSGTASGYLQSIDSSLKLLTSDQELKEEIVELARSPYQVPLYSWTWSARARELYGLVGKAIGVLAQDVLEVQPEAVWMDGETGALQVAYGWLE